MFRTARVSDGEVEGGTLKALRPVWVRMWRIAFCLWANGLCSRLQCSQRQTYDPFPQPRWSFSRCADNASALEQHMLHICPEISIIA
jgi:hypothetical protein